jgi:hypothetical protein
VSELSRAGRRSPAWHLPGSGGVPGARRLRLDRLIPRGQQWAAVAAIGVALAALSYGMNHTSYIIWGAFWVAPVLFILSVPLADRAARLDGDSIGRIVLVAAAVKVFVAPLLRYWMVFGLYGGSADAARYHQVGALLAPLFRHGIYQDLGKISDTRFLEVLTGQVYALIGATRLGGFVLFSWFGFLGCYLFYRAFRTAYPDGNSHRYALLVFFFPTLVFWPSSIGKEACMSLFLGAAALGAAQLFVGRFRGLVWMALGMWGAAVVRPHMALIVGAGLAAAAPIAVFRGGAHREGRQRGRLGGAVLVLTLVVAGPMLVDVATRFFGLESLNTETAQEAFDETTRRSGRGGSRFTTVSPDNPVGFVLSGVTVLFRPFPFEVRNAQAMLTSLEGLALLAVCALSLRRLVRLPLELFRRPYAAFAVVYTLAFIYAFSSLENFGILARQRSQVLPLVFVLLCTGRSSALSSGEPESSPLVNVSQTMHSSDRWRTRRVRQEQR